MELAAALLWITLRMADLQRPRLVESVTVTSAASSLATPSAVTRLDRSDLTTSPSGSLDDALRSVPGFSLFRRSSSRVANPTTQGATLRGLAASGSSRALVLADGAPLNDPVGGWVYWNRIPAAAISDVSVARGASGDLHGADALGGVIAIRSSVDRSVRLLAEAGDQRTGRVSGYGGTGRLFGQIEGFTTSGFVIVAPESRGEIDTAAYSRHGSAGGAVMLSAGEAVAWLRASTFAERRGNGTPLQRNATRVTQAAAQVSRPAGSYSGWTAHAYGSNQRYEQTFTVVTAGRGGEALSSDQDVGASAAGVNADWVWSRADAALALTSAGRFIDARLVEKDAVTGVRTIDARQATVALAGQGSYAAGPLSAGGGLRAELWSTSHLETQRHVSVSPRVWVSYRPLASRTALTIAFRSGYRGPTINELYRPFRVGAVLTEANPALRPERSRGVEGGFSHSRRRVSLRVAGFWTRIDAAIVNVTLSSAGGAIVRQRQNAAAIVARGAELEIEVRPARWLSATAASSYTRSLFEAGPLAGLQVPQVAPVHQALGVRAARGRARLSGEWRYLGRQYDDDRNLFPLGTSSVLDLRAGWRVRHRTELFCAVENALDEEQDVGRTPLRTIGLPRTTRVGVRIGF